MAVFLLDTDMLSLHQRNQSRVIAAVDSHATDQLCVSTVTLEEQIGGWSALARSAKTPQAGEQSREEARHLIYSSTSGGIVLGLHDRVLSCPIRGPFVRRVKSLKAQIRDQQGQEKQLAEDGTTRRTGRHKERTSRTFRNDQNSRIPTTRSIQDTSRILQDDHLDW